MNFQFNFWLTDISHWTAGKYMISAYQEIWFLQIVKYDFSKSWNLICEFQWNGSYISGAGANNDNNTVIMVITVIMVNMVSPPKLSIIMCHQPASQPLVKRINLNSAVFVFVFAFTSVFVFAFFFICICVWVRTKSLLNYLSLCSTSHCSRKSTVTFQQLKIVVHCLIMYFSPSLIDWAAGP